MCKQFCALLESYQRLSRQIFTTEKYSKENLEQRNFILCTEYSWRTSYGFWGSYTKASKYATIINHIPTFPILLSAGIWSSRAEC
jgi:hypothetical protein